tara:strand:- start:688 stop:852 length:165 start_codon:yes stop_codon:yes gene_type:complete
MNENDNPITLEDLNKPVNKTEVDLKNYGPAYSAALSNAIDEKEAKEQDESSGSS